jgi:peptidoglycan/LPS O-acetylase OafA/YrhL
MSSLRIPSLDGIRAFSIFLVLASHFGLSLVWEIMRYSLTGSFSKQELPRFANV